MDTRAIAAKDRVTMPSNHGIRVSDLMDMTLSVGTFVATQFKNTSGKKHTIAQRSNNMVSHFTKTLIKNRFV
jgi:hypothetical protein